MGDRPPPTVFARQPGTGGADGHIQHGHASPVGTLEAQTCKFVAQRHRRCRPCKSAGFATPLTALYLQILAFAFSCYRGHRRPPTCGVLVRPGGQTTTGLRSTPRQWRDKCRHLTGARTSEWGSWVFPLNHVRRPDTGNCYSLVSTHFRGRPLAIILNLV